MGSTSKAGLEVAIIGGGITGLCLALGLEERGVNYKIYERASDFREIGAGVGFSPNAEWAMELLNKNIHTAFKTIANPNGEDYFQWIDGYETEQLIFKLFVGDDKFQGCRRSDFINEMVKLIPLEKVAFGKEVDKISDGEDGRPTVLFTDGTSIQADMVIGCDGIRSRVRQILLGEDNPASHPDYTHRYCFRALFPTDTARDAIGENGAYLVSTRFMYNGDGGHIITYPVAHSSLLNALFVITDYGDWTSKDGKLTARTSKQDAVDFFKDWKHPAVRALVDLLPDVLDKWALFDMMKHPAPAYNKGSVCIAGDAAHASGPHLGGGAGFGIEDALVLATVLDHVNKKSVSLEGAEKIKLRDKALETYNTVRYERTQWLIKATREACALFHLKPPEVPSSAHKEMFGKEISERFHRIWDEDMELMVVKTREIMEQSST